MTKPNVRAMRKYVPAAMTVDVTKKNPLPKSSASSPGIRLRRPSTIITKEENIIKKIPESGAAPK